MTPPPPPPAYAPPLLHFLVIEFSYTCGTHQCTFWCKTDVACHLTAHITAERPRIRYIPDQKRGAQFTLSSMTCFVEIAQAEQLEPADTLEHTFLIPFPLYDHAYYWYLSGTILGVPCKSISQVFWHNCSRPPITATFHSDPGFGRTTCDVYLQTPYRLASWQYHHDLPTADLGIDQNYLVWHTHTYWTGPYFAYIQRNKMTFSLLSIPTGSRILAASLHLYTVVVTADATWKPQLAICTAHIPPANNWQPQDYGLLGTTPLSDPIPFSSLPPHDWTSIPFNSAGLAHLIPGQIAAIGFREYKYDMLNVPPPYHYPGTMAVQVFSAEQTFPDWRPYLQITYQEPP